VVLFVPAVTTLVSSRLWTYRNVIRVSQVSVRVSARAPAGIWPSGARPCGVADVDDVPVGIVHYRGIERAGILLRARRDAAEASSGRRVVSDLGTKLFRERFQGVRFFSAAMSPRGRRHRRSRKLPSLRLVFVML
jgi:hypothetical protein